VRLTFASSCAPRPPELTDQAFLDLLEQRTFYFFWDRADPLPAWSPIDTPRHLSRASRAVGFGLTAYPIGVERGYVTRADAADRILRTLRSSNRRPKSDDPKEATGYKGFYYHFLI